MAYDTSMIKTGFGGGDDFGHRDYTEARRAGISNERIIEWMNDNEGKLIGKNVQGGGGLYDEVTAMGKGREARHPDKGQINTDYGWRGNDNTYNPDATYKAIEYSPRVSEAKERSSNFRDKYVYNEPEDNPVFTSPSGINPQPQRNSDGSIVGGSSAQSKKATKNFLNSDYHLNLDDI